MKKYFALLLIISAACSSFFLLPKEKRKFLITDYGAKADTSVINTTAIQKTIDDCAAKGGGVVIIPEGTFISGAVFLKKNVSLTIEKNGVLKGSANQKDYPQIPTRWEGEERVWTSAFINVIGVDNIELTGEGTIDGSGDTWVSRSPPQGRRDTTLRNTGPRLGRPRLICFDKCTNVKISNLHLHNQAVWCVHILYCKKVLIENLNITADHNIPSSDGMDIDSSDGVTVRGCYINVNDDCISIKSGKDEDGLRVNRPSENIVIENCTFGYGHGGVAMGSETSGGIRNVEVRNCVVQEDNWEPIRFKTQPSRSGVVENITYRNIVLKDTRKAFAFNMEWRMVNPKPPAEILPVVRNINIINVTGNVDAVGDMHGLKGSPIDGVTFKDCNITAKKGFVIQYAKNVDLSGLKITGVEGQAVVQKIDE
ncbi:MAG: glycoside hydrolase family 28 protein [Ferruginibacter sp.]